MKFIKQFFISSLCIALISAILLPDTLKFSHIFFDHDHVVCNNHTKTHFHELDFKCQALKFKQTNQIQFKIDEFVFHEVQIPSKHNFNFYFFLSEYQSLHFSLRGPPSFS